jgi:carboxyl-terminal processing protease
MIPGVSRRHLPPRLALAAALAVAFGAGVAWDPAASAKEPAPRPYRSLDLFSQVIADIQNNYVEEVAERELVYGAIEGMMSRLDPHSVFMRPDVYRQMRDDTSGEFDGLGLEVTLRDGVVTVVSPVADSPGERAGIRPGDRVLSIDGAPTKDLPLGEVIRRMKGPAGSRSVLELMRDGFSTPQRLTLVRDRVRTQPVEHRVLDAERRYAYVRVKTFQERTDHALERALQSTRTALRGDLRGLVLDLRNNPGGLLEQAIGVADVFLASGVIVTTEGRGRRNVEVRRAHEKGTEPSYPLIVLVNKGTASASEIVAGALQDHGRAVIMGTPTFGKGSVQTIIELEDGSGLKLTVARYYTPKHRSIQELGVSPDVVVADTAAAQERLPGGAHPGPRGEVVPAVASPAPSAGEDYALRTALDYLRAVDIFKASSEAPRGVASKRD